MAGTSGGITTNGLWGYGIFDYPIILDLLDAAGVTLEGLQRQLGQRPVRQHRQRRRVLGELRPRQPHARQRAASSTTCARTDCRRSRSSSRASRAASTSTRRPTCRSGWASRRSSSPRCASRRRGTSSAYILTYDEHGGYFDHVPPPQVDAFGLGDPGPDLGHLAVGEAGPPRAGGATTCLDPEVHRAALRPRTLARANHRFDSATPIGGNYQAAGRGPRRTAGAATRQPRDIGDLFECFTF